MLTKSSFDEMNEAALREEVIIPLLTAMGYKDVFHWHGGSGEQGKDIVCWKHSDLNKRENLAVVAKAVKTSGQAKLDKGSAGDIQTQIRQCFGKPYNAPGSMEEQWIHRVWVVSNKQISKETQDSVKSSLGDNPLMVRNVEFIHGDKLWEMVEQHLPVSMFSLIQEIQEHSQLDDHYAPHITIGPNKTEITLAEKYPGAAEDKPINITTFFVDEEAVKSFEAILQRYKETGETAEIPSELIEKVEFPEFLESLFGMKPGKTTLTLIPPPVPAEFPVRIRVLCDDGEEYIREHVLLRGEKGGTKQATIVSLEKDVPFRLRIEMRAEGGIFSDATFNVQTREAPYNAVQYWEWLRLNTCLSKPCRIQFESVEGGFVFLEARAHVGMGQPPSTDLVEFYRCLSVVQKETKTQIFIPERSLTEEETRLVQELYHIVTAGHFDGTWNNFVYHFPALPDVFNDLHTNFSERTPQIFVEQREKTETLFGVEIPLGVVRTAFYNTVLKGTEEITVTDEDLGHEIPAIRATFQPFGEAKVTQDYLEWLPAEMMPSPLIPQSATEAD